MHEPNEHLTLTEAAKLAPGRPSSNCIWRWCRRGVLARGGERIRLEHIRAGGKILTTAAWLATFTKRLAEADTAYFDRREREAPPPPPRLSRAQLGRHARKLDAIERSRRMAKEAGR
jgi:hypothetical protein